VSGLIAGSPRGHRKVVDRIVFRAVVVDDHRVKAIMTQDSQSNFNVGSADA
jgi:hypothetical protein